MNKNPKLPNWFEMFLWKLIRLFSMAFYGDLPYKLNNILWRFHKNDVDDIISIPHGDSIDAKQKLQLNPYNGIIFHGKKETGKISKKEFNRLWSDVQFLKYATEARNVYLSSHPNAILSEMPKIKNRKQKSNSVNEDKDYQIKTQAIISKNHQQ